MSIEGFLTVWKLICEEEVRSWRNEQQIEELGWQFLNIATPALVPLSMIDIQHGEGFIHSLSKDIELDPCTEKYLRFYELVIKFQINLNVLMLEEGH